MLNNQNQTLTIELIYPLPDEQKIITIEVSPQTTIEQAIEQSDILQQYPTIDLAINKVGIFSKVCQLTDTLRDGDRIEIYRALIADPKEARKARALKQKS